MYETPFYDRPGYVDPRSTDKYKNITNVSQLSNKYIKQLNSNEFIIKCNKSTCRTAIVFIIFPFIMISIWTCIILFDERIGIEALIIVICFFGMCCCIGLYH